MKCIQCESMECGAYLCRFSGMPHEEYRAIKSVLDADKAIKRDKEEPKWLRELRQGARDIPVGQ